MCVCAYARSDIARVPSYRNYIHCLLLLITDRARCSQQGKRGPPRTSLTDSHRASVRRIWEKILLFACLIFNMFCSFLLFFVLVYSKWRDNWRTRMLIKINCGFKIVFSYRTVTQFNCDFLQSCNLLNIITKMCVFLPEHLVRSLKD